jgi:heme/copper-type cytochrome/quinol oxidase subunit 2
MGLALLAVIWLITFVSTYFFIWHPWWLPAGASAAAAGIDQQFTFSYIVMGIVFVLAQCSLGLFVWMYRERKSSPPADYSHGNTTMEVVWTVLTAVLFVGMNLMGSDLGGGTV